MTFNGRLESPRDILNVPAASTRRRKSTGETRLRVPAVALLDAPFLEVSL